MARRLGSSSKGKKSKEKETNWVTLASVLESKKGNIYFKGEEYFGDLLFRDKEGNVFKINMAGIFDPHENAPDFVQNVIRVNLEDSESAEPVELEELE